MNKSLYLIMAVLVLCGHLQARQRTGKKEKTPDSLAVIREFIQINNDCRRMPVYLEMELINATNFITGEQDTAHLQAAFYIKPGASYIRFGETEQLGNDSMALIISNTLQRMILYEHAQPMLQQMQLFTGAPSADSSVLPLAQKFTGRLVATGQSKATIELTGRTLLAGTVLPKELIVLQYDAVTKQPLQIITTKRTLLPVSEEDYAALTQQGITTDKLITIEGRGRYLVKEQTGTFVYKKVTHDAGMTVPVTIADRIIKNEQGGFTPAKAYEAYAFVLN